VSTTDRKVKVKPTQKKAVKHGVWQVQTAKAQFSELLRRAREEGVQIVTKQGKDEVVVMPIEQYRKLTRRSGRPASLVQFFAQSPLADIDLNLDRDRDYGRGIEL
jgi:prevent-host-death family protein